MESMYSSRRDRSSSERGRGLLLRRLMSISIFVGLVCSNWERPARRLMATDGTGMAGRASKEEKREKEVKAKLVGNSTINTDDARKAVGCVFLLCPVRPTAGVGGGLLRWSVVVRCGGRQNSWQRVWWRRAVKAEPRRELFVGRGRGSANLARQK